MPFHSLEGAVDPWTDTDARSRSPCPRAAARSAGLAPTRTGRAALTATRHATSLRASRPLRSGSRARPIWPLPGREVSMVARSALLHQRASEMRHAPTRTEQRLWQRLSGSQLGVGFRRQVVIGEYIADFAAPSRRLVVEVDGGAHASRRHLDARRDARLTRAGWRVLRLEAALVEADVEAALARVRRALEA